METQWLLRTALNRISGPYTREEVRELIREGVLGLQDELCPANGHWILLSEREEIRREFDIEISSELTEDVTTTGTHTETATETENSVSEPSPLVASAGAIASVEQGSPPEASVGEGQQARKPALLPALIWVLLIGAFAVVLGWVLSSRSIP